MYTFVTLLLWSAIGCLMLARINNFLLSIVEAAAQINPYCLRVVLRPKGKMCS